MAWNASDRHMPERNYPPFLYRCPCWICEGRREKWEQLPWRVRYGKVFLWTTFWVALAGFWAFQFWKGG